MKYYYNCHGDLCNKWIVVIKQFAWGYIPGRDMRWLGVNIYLWVNEGMILIIEVIITKAG